MQSVTLCRLKESYQNHTIRIQKLRSRHVPDTLYYRPCSPGCFLGYPASEVRAQAAQTQDTSLNTSDTATQQPNPLKRKLSDKEIREQQKELRQELKGPYKKWLDQDVRWIITDQERNAFLSLSNDEERDAFIEQFWRRRNPDPESPDNSYREEIYRRIAYANEHFAAGKPGWMTDRGHMYIAWGPPDSIDSHPAGGPYNRPMSEGGGQTETYPFEVWNYRPSGWSGRKHRH